MQEKYTPYLSATAVAPVTWVDAIQMLQQQGDAYALVTLLGCTGSTPRDHGSKMVVSEHETFDTIGGGHLEYVVTKKARDIINNNKTTANSQQEIHHLPLGASLGQCCGGSATVLIETFAACQFHIGLFGAGHVAKSLVTILSGLKCKVSWIDSRESEFPGNIPANVKKIVTDDLCGELENLPKGSDVLILTHNHQLDFDLCLTALKRHTQPDQALRSIGLIGSQTKALRFQKRLIDRLECDAHSASHNRKNTETTHQLVGTIRCPVGLSSVPGKLPMEVAVSIAGELIALEQAQRGSKQSLQSKIQSPNTNQGLAWKTIKQELSRDINTSGTGAVMNLTRNPLDCLNTNDMSKRQPLKEREKK